MAININSVYKAVLVVLEQEKRGVLTPNEFNRIATQAQQEIFTQYFDDLNQLLGMPQTSLAYADRMALLDEKISIFKKVENVVLTNNVATPTSQVQELGSVIYNNPTSGALGREAQRIQQHEVFTTNQSPLTAPTAHYPVYTYEGNKITMFPSNLPGNNSTNPDPTINEIIQLNYLSFPTDVKWGFNIDPELGHYIYNPLDSTDFEIHKSDQPLLIDKILGYAGVMTKDQFVMSLANSKEQQINVNDQK
jgi:hypothetical protein